MTTAHTHADTSPTARAEARERARPEAEDAAEHEPRSFPSLIRELRDEAVTLVQKEFHLARAEISQKVNEAQRAAMSSATGAAMLMAGLITLCAAASAALYVGLGLWGLDPLVALWLAPLIVGVLVAIIGGAMVTRAKKVTRADHWRPERTERSVRETKAWAERKV